MHPGSQGCDRVYWEAAPGICQSSQTTGSSLSKKWHAFSSPWGCFLTSKDEMSYLFSGNRVQDLVKVGGKVTKWPTVINSLSATLSQIHSKLCLGCQDRSYSGELATLCIHPVPVPTHNSISENANITTWSQGRKFSYLAYCHPPIAQWKAALLKLLSYSSLSSSLRWCTMEVSFAPGGS